MKRFLIIALLIKLVVQSGSTLACAGGDDDYYDFKYFFSPRLLSDTSLTKYFPEITSCEICGALLKNAVLQEWQQKFPSCRLQDLETALYSRLTVSQTETLAVGNNPLPGNSFYDYILANNQAEIVGYLSFLAEENKLMMGSDDQWDTPSWEDEQKNLNEGQRLLELATEKLNETSDPFIKERYIFQVIKLLHYTENYEKAISFYQSFYPVPSSTLTYYRTLGYYAGAKRKTGKEAEAKYLFATIFDKCPPIRYQAYKDFKFIDQDENQWRRSLAMAKSNSERSAMWVAKNIYDYTIDIAALRELYESDSSDTRLELALLKQLNNFHYSYYITKLKEDISLDTTVLVKKFTIDGEVAMAHEKQLNWLARWWQNILDFFGSLFGKSKSDTLKWNDQMPAVTYQPVVYQADWAEELMELLNKIISEKKVARQELYLLARGYLQIATGAFKEGEASLTLVQKGKDATIDHLVEYLTLWSQLLKAPSLDDQLESKVLAYLNKNKNEFELEEELARRYFIEKKYEKAFQSVKRDNMLAFFDDTTIKEIINQGNKNLSSAFITYFGRIDEKKLKAAYAEKLFLAGKFEEALTFANLKLEFLEEASYNEDGEIIAGGPTRQSISYADINKLDKKATSESYLKIAEALATSSSLAYNSSPWYNYYPYSYSRASTYPFNVTRLAETVENRFNYYSKLVYSTDLAERYYRKAYELLNSDEEKARVLVMAQQIAMKDKYAFKDDTRWSGEVGKSYYYEELKDKYPNTDIVKELNQSCSFYRNEKITYY
jgi:hypothetical protein